MACWRLALLVTAAISVYLSLTVKGSPVPATIIIQNALTGTDTVDVACIGQPTGDRVLPNKQLRAGEKVQWSFSTSILDSTYTVCTFDLKSTLAEQRATINVWFGPLKPDSICDRFRYRCDVCSWEVHYDALYLRKQEDGQLYACREWSTVLDQ